MTGQTEVRQTELGGLESVWESGMEDVYAFYRESAPPRVALAAALVESAVSELTKDARLRLGKTQIRIESLPALDSVKAGTSPDAPSVRQRVPADVLTLYQVNLENRCGSETDLARLVGRTLARA